MKYSDIFCGFLKQAGYTHCFCLQGGGIMHLINSAADCFTMVPVVNEIAGAIASEYFNNTESDKKAFLLVTTGPGLTNTITGIAGAFMESRDLLVIAGQVKISDLSMGEIRQRGIQECGGALITKHITKFSDTMLEPWKADKVFEIINIGLTPRRGPVVVEIPLNVSAMQIEERDFLNAEYSFNQNLPKCDEKK
jgi:acetolactate synthase-1/2/3 large subunit